MEYSSILEIAEALKGEGKRAIPVSLALRGVGDSISEVACSLDRLGLRDADTSMGAIEAHARAIKEAGESIAAAISLVAAELYNLRVSKR